MKLTYKQIVARRCKEKHGKLLGPLRDVAKRLGYALAVHGSLARDIDYVAVPWVDRAVPAQVLAAHFIREVERVNGFVYVQGPETAKPQKAHGRLCWSVHLGGGPYIDLSVVARAR